MKKIFIIILIVTSFWSDNIKKSYAAENIYLYRGTFSRTISVNELEEFLKNRKPNKRLKKIIRLANQNEDELIKTLEYSIKMPISITSKLMYSRIGESIIKRITKIIYPNKHKESKISIMAIRSAIIKASAENNGKLSAIEFFKAYPNKNLAININALSNTLEKIESLSELIEFYSNSPLEKLKDGNSKT